ncbi:hypothetical protein MMC24_000996 [Lignoscripta atroalba]|nr:hypothetical protein [Lignoscripta atroalba]
MTSSVKRSTSIVPVGIDPKGDVILVVVGTETRENSEAEQQQLLVSSSVLSFASKVMAAMFGPHFKEGQGLDSSNPPHILFPDDDPSAMTLICKLLHHQYYPDDEADLTHSLLVSLAIICNKYDCAAALQYASSFWIEPFVHLAPNKTHQELLGVTYLFDNPRMFNRVTKELLLKYEGPYINLETGFAFPCSLLPTLEAKRAVIRQCIHNRLQNLITSMVDIDSVCTGYTVRNYVSRMKSAGIWPMTSEGVYRLLDRLLDFPKRTTFYYRECPNCSNPHDHKFDDAVRDVRSEILNSVEGLCLDCINAGGRNSKVCRVKHS